MLRAVFLVRRYPESAWGGIEEIHAADGHRNVDQTVFFFFFGKYPIFAAHRRGVSPVEELRVQGGVESHQLNRGICMDRFSQLKELVDSFDKDFQKFYDKGNKAAGVRVRKHMQELRAFAQVVRNEVQTLKRDDDDSPGE